MTFLFSTTFPPPPLYSLAQVHLRLGDLNMVNGMYNEAAEEFEKCLVHRLALPRPGESRAMADAHVCKAQALFYASTLEGAEKVGLGNTRGKVRPPLFPNSFSLCAFWGSILLYSLRGSSALLGVSIKCK